MPQMKRPLGSWDEEEVAVTPVAVTVVVRPRNYDPENTTRKDI